MEGHDLIGWVVEILRSMEGPDLLAWVLGFFALLAGTYIAIAEIMEKRDRRTLIEWSAMLLGSYMIAAAFIIGFIGAQTSLPGDEDPLLMGIAFLVGLFGVWLFLSPVAALVLPRLFKFNRARIIGLCLSFVAMIPLMIEGAVPILSGLVPYLWGLVVGILGLAGLVSFLLILVRSYAPNEGKPTVE